VQVRPSQPIAAINPSVSDEQLVARARSGDRWARAALFRNHAPRLLRTLMRLLRNRADAEDALQDTFVRAFEHLDVLREPAALPGWLTQIAVHQAHRQFRRGTVRRLFGQRAQEALPLGELVDEGLSPEAHADLTFASRAVGKLPAKVRVAWLLRHLDSRTLEEVADACDCSLATAKRRVAAAEERLRSLRTDGDTDA